MKKTLIVIFFMILFSFATLADLEEGLVVYLNFDQGKVDTVKDMSNSGNNGVVKGNPKWVPGPRAELGSAVEFDGVESYIEVADNDSLDFGEDDVTMMLWIKQDVDQVDYPRPISKMPLFGTDKPGFDVITVGLKQPALRIFYGMSGNTRQEVDGGQLIADGEWHHLVAMKDEEEGKIYIDGNLVGSAPFTPLDISNDYPLIIGANAEPAAHVMFKGVVDEVAVYNRALTEDEILTAMDGKVILAVEPGNKAATLWAEIKR
ncbi:hypothetical protein GF312_02890 [Candidatus Poribacteria bacterium]|nr:hypothetical protein [Candidatus Poribacteria bacterium]